MWQEYQSEVISLHIWRDWNFVIPPYLHLILCTHTHNFMSHCHWSSCDYTCCIPLSDLPASLMHPIIVTTFLLSQCFAWNLRTFFSHQNPHDCQIMMSDVSLFWQSPLNRVGIGMSYTVGKLRKCTECWAPLCRTQKHLIPIRMKEKKCSTSDC